MAETAKEETSSFPTSGAMEESATTNGAVSAYPAPEAAYEKVVEDSAVFLATLERLHRQMGTKFMVPRIGGKALDLHRLFVEVTSRGGLEKAITERKWREVIALFNFPSTITSASYVLRKYYLSLLHVYEQVYFFRNRAFDSSLTVVSPSQAKGIEMHSLQHSSPEDGSVVGLITGKFDEGYLVTARIGSEALVGVLYHVPRDQPNIQSPSYLTPCQLSRKKSRKLTRDPFRPKSNRSGYNFFFAEQYAKLKPTHSGEENAITKQIGQLWNQMNTAEKEVYQEKGTRDKERYLTEMLEYRKSSNALKPN